MRIIVERDLFFSNFLEFYGFNEPGNADVIMQVHNDEVVYIFTNKKSRRKGYARSVYEYACEYLGKNLKPASILNTTEATEFWKSVLEKEGDASDKTSK